MLITETKDINTLTEQERMIIYYQLMDRISGLLLNDEGSEYILIQDRWDIVNAESIIPQLKILNYYMRLDNLPYVFKALVRLETISIDKVVDTIRRRVASTI